MIKELKRSPIAADDLVREVLARDELLIEVFARSAPHFERLRDPDSRRVMGALVTVDQAARIAGLDTGELIQRLNDALGIDASTSSSISVPSTGPASAQDARPMAHPEGARTIELDVREDLRAGREPFSKIMAAVAALGDDEILHLRAIFEPSPLLPVLAKRGFTYETRSHADDDWSVWFWRPAKSHADAVWLDVRGLEPPEPLVRTMAALGSLLPGQELVQVNARVPRFLLPLLAERGYAVEIEESESNRVLVHIRRVRDGAAARQ